MNAQIHYTAMKALKYGEDFAIDTNSFEIPLQWTDNPGGLDQSRCNARLKLYLRIAYIGLQCCLIRELGRIILNDIV